ncbi:hypothetical protein [Tianweitania sediminis]|uniref:Uncharacterized protein n=1 Tax=Tianweitania sediminis TaxID=1502156 RepID=A0A8J7UKS6_9HYPH|nr:hypothetical protein [Tianweitania sediminis]MBP0441498.1 hypothetical protein [Tianweitania sediminis]
MKQKHPVAEARFYSELPGGGVASTYLVGFAFGCNPFIGTILTGRYDLGDRL